MQLIFPGLETMVQAAAEQERSAKRGETDVSRREFLKYLGQMRIVFLQDGACVQDEFPTLCIFEHPVFEHALWPEYKAGLLARIANAGTLRSAALLRDVGDVALRKVLFSMQEQLAKAEAAGRARDDLLHILVGYIAKLSGNVLQTVKGVELSRQQHTLLSETMMERVKDFGSNDPRAVDMHDILCRAQEAAVSPLHPRPFPGQSSPGLGRGVTIQPRVLAREFARTGVDADVRHALVQALASSDGAAAVVAPTTVPPASVCGVVGGATSLSALTQPGQSRSVAAPAASEPLRSCVTESGKPDLAACKSIDSLLYTILPLDARRREKGWSNIAHLISKSHLSKWNGFLARYKARSQTAIALLHCLSKQPRRLSRL